MEIKKKEEKEMQQKHGRSNSIFLLKLYITSF